jgi:hypothetical protein
MQEKIRGDTRFFEKMPRIFPRWPSQRHCGAAEEPQSRHDDGAFAARSTSFIAD